MPCGTPVINHGLVFYPEEQPVTIYYFDRLNGSLKRSLDINHTPYDETLR